MQTFKGTSYQDRQANAAQARRALADKFKERPGADDPTVVARQEARREILRARAEREAERDRQRQIAAVAEAKRLEAERIAREETERRTAEEAAQLAALEAEEKAKLEVEKKAERDARYAARKANKLKRKQELKRMW
jgi:hypothetical protein